MCRHPGTTCTAGELRATRRVPAEYLLWLEALMGALVHAHPLHRDKLLLAVLTIVRKRGNSVKFTGERHLFTGEERGGAGEVHR